MKIDDRVAAVICEELRGNPIACVRILEKILRLPEDAKSGKPRDGKLGRKPRGYIGRGRELITEQGEDQSLRVRDPHPE